MAKKRIYMTESAAKKLGRLHRKIEKNIHVDPPLTISQDSDHIHIGLSGSLANSKPVRFLKYVSGPDANGIYTMQPVEKHPNGTWVNAGSQVYMEA